MSQCDVPDDYSVILALATCTLYTVRTDYVLRLGSATHNVHACTCMYKIMGGGLALMHGVCKFYC